MEVELLVGFFLGILVNRFRIAKLKLIDDVQ